MKKHLFSTVISNERIAENIYDMSVCYQAQEQDGLGVKAGQFAQLFLDSEKNLLPRPISICDFDEDKHSLRFVYQLAGEGTKAFSELVPGDTLRMLVPLGNGFNVSTNKKSIALVGGGVGVPPMLALAKACRVKNPNATITAILGFRSETILIEDFRTTGVDVAVATDDGSVGFKGNCVQYMRESGLRFDIVYSCGPRPMLKSLAGYCAETDTPCFVSMEERMACGIGVCVGCAVLLKSRSHPDNPDENYYKKVCKEGPVFNAKEVAW